MDDTGPPFSDEQRAAIRQLVREEITRALRQLGELAPWITEVEEVREYDFGLHLPRQETPKS